VTDVVPRSPAGDAGLEAGDTTVVVNGESYVLGGDIITRVDGKAVDSAEDVGDAVAEKEPGDEMELEVRRGDETEQVTIELGRRPADVGG
jgi:serine protease Do